MAGVATCHRGTKSRLNDEVEDDVRDIERAWQPKGNGLPATRQVADIGTYWGNRYKDDNALRDYLNGGVETSQGLMIRWLLQEDYFSLQATSGASDIEREQLNLLEC